MPFAKDSLSTNAMGGSEIMKYALQEKLDPALLKNFQIFVSRVQEELSPKHIRLYWCQDLAGDPSAEHLHNRGWEKFHKIVFSSHWQMRGYIERYQIPWSKCVVLHNCINPINFTMEEKNRETIRLIYHTTPHRGLQILVPVFKKLKEKFDNIELDVYSSFNIYGWGERDKPFQELFEDCKNTPGINYHGSVSNKEIHEILKSKHIFSYPSIWEETSCIAMMEAMSAGLICVHPNYGALQETSSNWTHMYHWDEDINRHANAFYSVLANTIDNLINMSEEEYEIKIMNQKNYTDIYYNWDLRIHQWNNLLNGLLHQYLSEDSRKHQQMFVYKT
jgi:glycosyltransferase involved in cell wall biosynthesis